MIRHAALTGLPRLTASLLAIGALSGTLACGGKSETDVADSAVVPRDSAGKYRAAVDEGLGASVAILVDNSGSMRQTAEGDRRPKYIVAREAIEAMLASTDSFVARQPDFPINVGIYRFSGDVTPVVPVARYDRATLEAALDSMPGPKGGTAIGTAMETARADLYRAGTFRKYILVITDGENTSGPSPRRVAEEIDRRSEGAVRMYFVAFDVDAERFAFVRDVRGEVVGAHNGDALRARLDEIYRGKILSEAVDAGETRPAAADSATRDSTTPPPTPKRDTRR